MKKVDNFAKGNGKDQVAGQEGPVFSVHSIYVKDLSFEAPLAPHSIHDEWKPNIDFDLQMGSNPVSEEEHIYEVVLHLTVTVNLKKDDKPIFLVEVKQAGVFTAEGFAPDVLKQVLATSCPTVLFPYAREAVSSLVQKGGFPNLLLPPINFDAMYAHHLSQNASENQSAESRS